MEEITPEDSIVPVYLVPETLEEEDARAQVLAEIEQRTSDEELTQSRLKAAQAKLLALGLTAEEVAVLFRAN